MLITVWEGTDLEFFLINLENDRKIKTNYSSKMKCCKSYWFIITLSTILSHPLAYTKVVVKCWYKSKLILGSINADQQTEIHLAAKW